jgi:DNA mismatch endonuclease (patch repair protein)
MTDTVDKTIRSRIMRSVPHAHTKLERALRLSLHAIGFRYRLGGCGLPGSPDPVLHKHRAVVFVHGCFWHRHAGCRYATTPSTRADFWQSKFEANVARDNAVQRALLAAGWRVATIWECALRKPRHVAAAGDQLSTWLLAETDALELGEREIVAPPRENRDVSSSD